MTIGRRQHVLKSLFAVSLLVPAFAAFAAGAQEARPRSAVGDQATPVPEEEAASPPEAPKTTEEPLAVYLKDRGFGIATSMFGTYIRRGELIVYPYWEYYYDNAKEYQPEELGFAGQQDFRGRYRASEGLFFVAYGLTDYLAVQAEVAGIRASLDKSPKDLSGLPPKLQQSGLGSFETQFRWRWRKENERRPELWSYLDIVYPTNKKEPLIGTVGWELELGTGVTRGFNWGTLTARASLAYEGASTTKLALGEYAFEYLKRVSPSWRLFAAVQGAEDAVSLITEVQWHLTRTAFIRFNQELGLTSRATDWEPQIGIVFTLPTRR